MYKESGLSCLNFLLGLVKEGQILDMFGTLQMQQSIVRQTANLIEAHIFKEIKITQINPFEKIDI